jgi:hypothetical protein
MYVIFKNVDGSETNQMNVTTWGNDGVVLSDNTEVTYESLKNLNNIYVKSDRDKAEVQSKINSNTGYLNNFGVYLMKTGGSKRRRRGYKSKRRGNKKGRITKRRR